MQPGRELDALIAEKVMGITKLSHRPLDANEMCRRCFRPAGQGDNLPASCVAQPYSTDIAAAWEVVEKLDLFGKRDMFIYKNWRGKYSIDETVDAGMGTRDIAIAEADTAPQAICLAALKAVGE